MSIDEAIEVICRWGSAADRKIFVFDGQRKEIDRYLQAVDELQLWIASPTSADRRREAESAIQIAMPRLSDEFRNILKVNSKSTSSPNPNNTASTTMTDSNSSNYEVYEDDYVNQNSMCKEAIDDLRSIALRMNSSGYLHDCVNVYASERKSVVNAAFQRLSVQKLSKDGARRLEWGELESKINIWIKAAKICFKYYFGMEKQLCEQIFQGLGNNSGEACFMEIVKDSATQLFDTAEAFGCIRPASQRIFKILDLYDTLSGLQPWINKLFNTPSSEHLITKAATEILPLLVNAVNEILQEFETSLLNEKSRIVRGDPIHRLPKYVIQHIYKLCDRKRVLMGLPLSDPPSTDVSRTRFESLGFKSKGRNHFSVHIIWTIGMLVSGLEIKAAKDHFFAMNNLHYLVEKIKGRPELRDTVGDNNFNKLIGKFEQAKGDYLRSTFGKMLNCLRDEGLSKISPLRVLKLTERLKNFNGEFEKVEKDVKNLVVPDFQLVLELRQAICEMLVGAYKSFLLHIKSTPRLQMYVKYSAERLETAIQHFFIGTPSQ